MSSPPQCKSEQYTWTKSINIAWKKVGGATSAYTLNNITKDVPNTLTSFDIIGYRTSSMQSPTQPLTSGTYTVRYKIALDAAGTYTEVYYTNVNVP